MDLSTHRFSLHVRHYARDYCCTDNQIRQALTNMLPTPRLLDYVLEGWRAISVVTTLIGNMFSGRVPFYPHPNFR